MDSPTAAVVETPAAPVAAAPTISASRAASDAGNFDAFEKAESAKSKGTPLPDVAAPATPAKAAAPVETPAALAAPVEQPLSKRQQETNERIRQAVEAATRDTQAELTRLRAQVGQPPTPAAPAKPDTPSVPDWKRLASMPNAPKLADFESVEEHAAAMAFFVNTQLHQERTATERERAEHEQISGAHRARVESFDARVNDLAQSDPDIVSKIVPIAQALGTRGGPYSVISDLVLGSESGPQLLRHFHNDPQALESLVAMPERLRALPRLVAVREHIQVIVKRLGALEDKVGSVLTAAHESAAVEPSTISAAPPPSPQLSRSGTSTDPQKTAFARGDFATWDRLETEKARAKRTA